MQGCRCSTQMPSVSHMKTMHRKRKENISFSKRSATYFLFRSPPPPPHILNGNWKLDLLRLLVIVVEKLVFFGPPNGGRTLNNLPRKSNNTCRGSTTILSRRCTKKSCSKKNHLILADTKKKNKNGKLRGFFARKREKISGKYSEVFFKVT